jgi:hypothetical protein
MNKIKYAKYETLISKNFLQFQEIKHMTGCFVLQLEALAHIVHIVKNEPPHNEVILELIKLGAELIVDSVAQVSVRGSIPEQNEAVRSRLHLPDLIIAAVRAKIVNMTDRVRIQHSFIDIIFIMHDHKSFL